MDKAKTVGLVEDAVALLRILLPRVKPVMTSRREKDLYSRVKSVLKDYDKRSK